MDTTAYVYLLRCDDGSLSCGSTRKPIEQRVWEHLNGRGSVYTNHPKRQPVQLVWFWECQNVVEAYALDKRIQGWSRRKRELLIEKGLDGVIGYSARDRRQRWDR